MRSEKEVKKFNFIILATIILVLFWMGFIFNMSSKDGEKSLNISGQVIEYVISKIPQLKDEPQEVKENIILKLQFIVRKGAHFTAYMILGIVVSLLLLKFKNIKKRYLLSWEICILYAISDELHQLFVPGRLCEIRDVLIDSLGSFIGILLVIVFIRIFEHTKRKAENK